ncbi:coiled-coil domain-containing protein 81-like isoform X3 [Betta splendens]|uniref:Coiled-coil domain-containing protein 81-like isoform X3 n=1 Tax=Betta splendens TaxID=158456 RepID=A0A9W2XMK9_BETSP|nr:coiled-coil domain-containing protein 81-like isoform X3 [Betta splendens]
MTDVLRLVSQVGRRTLPTLSQLSENDIECIWADLSAFIERQMTSQKGVHLAGLGTFTFSQQQLNIGNKLTLIQRPIFLLAGKLSQSLGLKQTRPLATATHLPVVQLNFAAVSQVSPFSREVVEGCVRETLQLLFRALASEQNIFITFHGIGVLTFNNKKVRMKFNKDFINTMDGTGRMLLAFNNRPGSSVSLLSGGLYRLRRPQTANPAVLPTICSAQPDSRAGDKDGFCLSPAPDHRNAGEVPQQRESKTWGLLQPDKVKAVSLSEELNPSPPAEAADKNTTSTSPPEVSPKQEPPHAPVCCFGHARAGQELCYLCMQRAQRNVPVNLREQQQAEEKAQEKLLLLKEQQRDKRYMEEEQAKMSEQHERAKLVATFNLKMSEQKVKSSCAQHPVGDKKYTIPTEGECDSAGFNPYETVEVESNVESRERAQKLFNINISAANQRKTEELHNRQTQLGREREMLKHTKMELILDHINQFEKKQKVIKSLEDEWSRSVRLKRQREEEEQRFLRSAGQLLVDKLTQYRRCTQCQRRTNNCGETNIWKDSHYLSGSQFMI